MVKINTPDESLDSSTGKTAPSIDEDSVNSGPSATKIRSIPVRNTHNASEYGGGSMPSLPSKLPFD